MSIYRIGNMKDLELQGILLYHLGTTFFFAFFYTLKVKNILNKLGYMIIQSINRRHPFGQSFLSFF